MRVPRAALLLAMCFGALLVGWVSHMVAAARAGDATITSSAAAAEPVVSPTAPTAPIAADPALAVPGPPVEAVPAPAPPPSLAPTSTAAAPAVAPIIYIPVTITIVTSDETVPPPTASVAEPARPTPTVVPAARPRPLHRPAPPPAPAPASRRASTRPTVAPSPPRADHVPSEAPQREREVADIVAGDGTIIATGNDIVIASDGAIVTVGDHPVVRANTGDATASGAIAVDADESTLGTGNSEVQARIPATAPTVASAAAGLPAEGTPDGRPGAPGGTRAVGIAGYEDHAIEITGDGNIVTYDDSNVVKDRVGAVNGNTGDTDTSGLNAVDVERSRVRSGDSGNADETPDPPPFDHAAAPTTIGSSAGTTGASGASVADVNGVSTATADDSLVIGGDGVDDNGVRVHGNRNIAT